MEIQGTRFGVLEFEEKETITLSEGLLGFPMSKQFLMFPYGENSSFFWLQSVDEPEIAFIVVNPFDFFSDIEFVIQDEDALALQLEQPEDVEVFTLVTIPEGRPEEMRTNMAGPVVVNVKNRQGRQILVKEYAPRQPLIPQSMQKSYLKETERHRGTEGQRSSRRGRQRNRMEQPSTLKMAVAS